MKQLLHALVFILFLSVSGHAQLISKFTFENSNVLLAVYGPNATSVSSYAVSSTGGSVGNGLNAGSGAHDINMVIPGSSFMNQGIDISVDFRRKESQASFFTLGNLDFGISGGALYAKFALVKGSADTTINATNLYSAPTDNAFHTYRFLYNGSTGKATMYVDGTSVYTYTRAASTALSWTGATNVTVGTLMDGTGANMAILDNLVVSNPAGASTLPLQLLSFEAKKDGAFVNLNWSTSKEVNTRNFIIERSADGSHFEAIGVEAAQSGYYNTNKYQFTDSFSTSVNYYRLKMVDIDGGFTYSAIRIAGGTVAATVSCYPNPFVDQVKIRVMSGDEVYGCMVSTVDGKVVASGVVNGGQELALNLSSAPKGMLFVRIKNTTGGGVETFKLLKR